MSCKSGISYRAKLSRRIVNPPSWASARCIRLDDHKNDPNVKGGEGLNELALHNIKYMERASTLLRTGSIAHTTKKSQGKPITVQGEGIPTPKCYV